MIKTIHADSKDTYGAPRIHVELKAQGIDCGKKRVARLMIQAGLAGRCRRSFRKTTIRDPNATPATIDHIKRDFAVGEINTRWCGDITYIPTCEGWLYLATVIDIGSRRIVGWSIADHPGTELVSDALTMAHNTRRPTGDVIFHANRGCQYTSNDFNELADKLRITLSLGRKRRMLGQRGCRIVLCNAKRRIDRPLRLADEIVSTHGHIRVHRELVNLHRRHSTLGYLSPADYEAALSIAANVQFDAARHVDIGVRQIVKLRACSPEVCSVLIDE